MSVEIRPASELRSPTLLFFRKKEDKISDSANFFFVAFGKKGARRRERERERDREIDGHVSLTGISC